MASRAARSTSGSMPAGWARRRAAAQHPARTRRTARVEERCRRAARITPFLVTSRGRRAHRSSASLPRVRARAPTTTSAACTSASESPTGSLASHAPSERSVSARHLAYRRRRARRARPSRLASLRAPRRSRRARRTHAPRSDHPMPRRPAPDRSRRPEPSPPLPLIHGVGLRLAGSAPLDGGTGRNPSGKRRGVFGETASERAARRARISRTSSVLVTVLARGSRMVIPPR